MLNKNSKKGKCPFNRLKPCSELCILYRKGVRFNEQNNENFPFEDCGINIIADNLEAMHNRTYQMQKEVGDTKNVTIMKILQDIGKVDASEVERVAMKILSPPDKTKQIN